MTRRWCAATIATIASGSAVLAGSAGPLRAQGSAVAEVPTDVSALDVFALIVGANRSVDRGLTPLRYADDDAARYADLFRTIGARVELLARFDDNTRRLHPAASPAPPRRVPLREAVGRLASAADESRRRGRGVAFYFLYSGHGNVDQDEGYITLEDARLFGVDVAAEIVDRVRADRSHVIVDACHSFFLAQSRGTGGRRRDARGFSHVPALALRPDVGLLLSTSAARESHEWEAFQAGVFSHEVRSGLYGAADIDGDGRVSYPEIGAFVTRANAAIANERFRPEVFARPPAAGDGLVDLRAALADHVRVPAAEHAHFVLEDATGVRLAQFHKGAGPPLRILRPPGLLYLLRVVDGREHELPVGAGVIDVATIAARTPRVAARGAAHHAFGQIFALPFAAADVQEFAAAREAERSLYASSNLPLPAWRRRAGVAALSAAAVGAAAGAGLFWWAHSARESIQPETPQRDAATRNQQITTRTRAAAISLGAAAAALVGGIFLLSWGTAGDGAMLTATATDSEAVLGLHARF